ncbi:25199_t:CDS:10, partial [Gigaspora margarita]
MEDMEEDRDSFRIQIDKKDQKIKESTLFTKYAAISQDESFIVIFDDNADRFKLQMYKIDEDTKNKALSEERSGSLIFSENQKELMNLDDFSSWSIAVSNEHQENFRLIAISCISQGDMQVQPGSEKYKCGFTKIWMIENDFNIKECGIEIENGGIIQFISEADNFTLILLKGNGIYKYYLSYSSDYMQFQQEILVLNYPERIINALEYNCSKTMMEHKEVPSSDVIRKYLLRCLNSHYLLVDTSDRDLNKNIELYNLRTNQLMNVFKRHKLVLSILDRENPGSFTISSDEKLLAYVTGNDIKIYLIENGLELSSLSCKESGLNDVEFMKFVFDNEKLLIFKKDRAAIWDIFNSIKEFIEFIPLKDASSGLVKRMTGIVIGPIENESFMILNIRPSFDSSDDKQITWERLILNEHLKRSDLDSEDWKELNPSECIINDSLPFAPYGYCINENDKVKLTDLEESDLKHYLGIEPWAIHPAEAVLDTYVKQRHQFPRYVIYLDEEKQTRLLIGNNTIQVWRDEKLEFIRIVNVDPDTPEEPYEKFDVTKIRYGKQKLDLLISLEGKNIQIKIEHEDDIIQIVRDAINALIYLNSQNKSINIAASDKRTKFNEIVLQTRNIITRFITLYPNNWRLIDFRDKIMTKFINIRDFSLITRILFKKENTSTDDSEKSKLKTKSLNKIEKERPLHSWQVPLQDILPDKGTNIDVTMLILFLEYYSNNAMDNIEWMNMVSEIIPELYERKYGLYTQELFYKPCFGNKRLDLSSFKFYEIKKRSEDTLKVFIPITQLIPRDNDLNFINISDDEIPLIRMIITKLFLPGKFSTNKNEDYSPFIRIIKLVKQGDPFYENPSMEAITNMMWHFSKNYWYNILCIYVIYFLIYSTISWAYLARLEIYDNFAILFPLITVFSISINGYSIVDGFKGATNTLGIMFMIFISIVLLWYELGQALATIYWDPTLLLFLITIFGIAITLEIIIMASFINAEVSNAEKYNRYGALQIQNDFIYNYGRLEDSSLSSEMSLLTNSWNEKSVELDSKRLARLEKKYGLDLNEELD